MKIGDFPSKDKAKTLQNMSTVTNTCHNREIIKKLQVCKIKSQAVKNNAVVETRRARGGSRGFHSGKVQVDNGAKIAPLNYGC